MADLTVSRYGEADYDTITDALRAAWPGARILVRSGTYRESLRITKSVELIGDTPASLVTVESAERPCVVMASDYAHVSGITFKRVSFSGHLLSEHDEGALTVPRGHLVVSACSVLTERGTGVAAFSNRANVEISSTEFKCKENLSIRIKNGATATVEECIFDGGSFSAIWLSSAGE